MTTAKEKAERWANELRTHLQAVCTVMNEARETSGMELNFQIGKNPDGRFTVQTVTVDHVERLIG